MSFVQYRIRFNEPFKDGNVLAERARVGQVMVVDQSLLERLRQSGALVDVLQTVIPNPLKGAGPRSFEIKGTLFSCRFCGETVFFHSEQGRYLHQTYNRWPGDDGSMCFEDADLTAEPLEDAIRASGAKTESVAKAEAGKKRAPKKASKGAKTES